jgi:ERCC4-type nuclease
MASTKEREQFISLMSAHGIGYAQARLFLRHSKTHGRIQEAHCNGHPAMGNPNIPQERAAKLQEQFEKYMERRELLIERRLTELAQENGVAVNFESDPRGWTVKLALRDGREYGIPQ